MLFKAYNDLSQKYPQYRARYQALLSQMAKTEPRNPAVLSAIGSQAAVSGATDGLLQAQRDLGAAIAAGSTRISDFEADAYVLVRLGKLQEARSILKCSIELDPDATHFYKDLAIVLTQLHQPASALEVLKEELKIYPEDSSTRALIARLEQQTQ